jgi:DTW domain-containing protein YfiP
MHPDEWQHQKCGTGRLCHVALGNSKIFVGIQFDEQPDFQKQIADPNVYPVLLYPGKDSLNLSSENFFELPPGRSLLIVIIDGTWRQARKIVNASSSIKTLPRVSFSPTTPSKFIIKKQPDPNCLSTLEAIHEILLSLETRGYENYLEHKTVLPEILNDLVTFQLASREAGITRRNSSKRG